jgi:hypothetical protein
MQTLPNIAWEEYDTGIPPELNLPKKFTHWRKDQSEAVENIVRSQAPVYLLDAPTGSGKSLVGIAAYKRLTTMDRVLGRMTDDADRYRCIYLTRTIQLQYQVLADFEGRMVKGRSNYACNTNPKINADDCPSGCGKFCTYKYEKLSTVRSALAVLNDAYYLSEVNGPGQFSGANMVVVDEVDSIESCLMDIIKFSVSEGQCKKYGLRPPKQMESLAAWQMWTETASRTVTANLEAMERQLPLNMNLWSDTDIKNNKEVKRGQSFLHQMDIFRTEVNDSWILDLENKPKGWQVTFKPVTVGPYCEKYLWRHGKRFLGMSGTILDPQIMAEDLGITDYVYHRLDSHFPVENRLIRYRPVANLKYDQMEEERPKLLTEVANIIKQYQSENVLVHATSNKLRDYLVEMLPFQGVDPDRILTHDQETRTEKLGMFKQSRGLVMISPSFDRGVDLPGDECRCVIIAKMPYMSLGDKQVKARLALPNGQRWYNLRAVQTVMQMTGRAVRDKDDFADCFILDRQFNSLLARTRHLLPKWWLSAVRREEDKAM